MDNRVIALISALFVAMLLVPGALAMPRVPSEFSGWVIIDGAYAKDGTAVIVTDESGTVCGASLVKDGRYGPLSCQGDDPSTSVDEGPAQNEPLTFRVNGLKLNTGGSIVWRPAQVKEVNLVRGDVEKAGLFMQGKLNQSDSLLMISLSLLVICSLWLITFAALLLAKYTASKKKPVGAEN